MNIEIFTGHSLVEATKNLKDWILDNPKREIKSVNVNVIPMHDLYYDGNICNQWQEYFITIIHE